MVENEFYFLFECPLYSELRIQYLDCYFYEHPNNFKLRQLFNSTREKQATDLSIFIYKAFTLRNVTLYYILFQYYIVKMFMHTATYYMNMYGYMYMAFGFY